MPAPARKTTKAAAPADDKKQTTAAEAAVKEALGEGDVEMTFRGQKFIIRDSARNSFRYAMAVAGGLGHQMIYELIDPADKARFISTAREGEGFAEVSSEFFAALNAASGEGNS